VDKSTTNLSATATSHHHHHHHGHFRHRDLSLDHRRSRFVYQRSIDRNPLDAAHSVHCQDRCTHVRVCLLMLGQRTGLINCGASCYGLGFGYARTHDTTLRTSCEYVWSCATKCLRFTQGIERHRACGGRRWCRLDGEHSEQSVVPSLGRKPKPSSACVLML
jgi:hypothetical protein